MSRTYIAIDNLLYPDGDSAVIFRIEMPSDVEEAERSFILDCNGGGALQSLAQLGSGTAHPDDDIVAEAGAEVYRRLSKHPGVRDALERAVSAQGTAPCPILLETNAEEAETIPWEALRHPVRGFLALDDRWPIVRVTRSRGGAEAISRVLDMPLRVAAVLAAAQRDARPEWAALYKALREWGGDYRVSLFTCQQELMDEVMGLDDNAVTVDFVPTELSDLIGSLKSFEPHVLHFFTHGSAKYGGYLEVARLATLRVDAEPHFLNAKEIVPLCGSAVLAVLNACEGAQPVTRTNSLSYQLVKDGVPAAIGMREAVDSQDAHLFCGQVYPQFLRCLVDQLTAYEERDLDLMPTMRSSRSRLCARHGGPADVAARRHKEWTLPALYVRPEPLRVELIPTSINPAETEYLVAMLKTLRSQRTALHPDTPQSMTARLDSAIAELRSRLRVLEIGRAAT